MLNWLIQPFQGFAKTYKIKGGKTVPVTLFLSTNYSHSLFYGVLRSRSQQRNIHRKKVSLHCKANSSTSHGPTEEEYQVSCLVDVHLFFFSFFLSFLFFKSTFPVLFCFKMLLLQQFLLKRCCCGIYSLNMGKVLSLHIKIQGLPGPLVTK